MKFTTNKPELEKALKAVSRMAKSAKLGVLVQAKQDKVTLTVRDLHNSMAIDIDADVEATGATVVDCKLFLESIKPCQQAVTVEKNGRLHITDGLASISLTPSPADNYPVIECAEDFAPAFTISQPVLKSMLSSAAFAMSTDDMRPVLTGMHWQGSDAGLRIIAADGFKVVSHAQEVGNDVQVNSRFAITVSKEAVKELSSNLGKSGTVTAEVSYKHVRLSFDSFLMVFRLLDGTYINVDQYYPQKFVTEWTFNSKELVAVLKRVMSITGKDAAVNFKLSGDGVSLYSKNNDTGAEHREGFKCQVTGEDMDIIFNAKMLGEAISSIPGKVTVHLTYHLGPCIIKTEDVPGKWILAMPIRLT